MHIIWDWNGTLLDDHSIVVEAANASVGAIGGGPFTADDYRDHYQRPVRLFYESLMSRPLSDKEWNTVNATFHSEYLERLDLARPALSAAWAIDQQSRNGSQSILSMWNDSLLVGTVKSLGLDRSMAAVRGSMSGEGECKGGLLTEHVRDLRSKSIDGPFVVVGDSIDDADAATEAGIQAILFNGGAHHRRHLVERGVPVADSLGEAVAAAAELRLG